MENERAAHSSVIKASVISVKQLDESDRLVLEEAERSLVSSIDSAKDFCKTLAGFSSGAIPIYFAILKLMGIENAASQSQYILVLLSVLPPLFFLFSIVTLAVVLVPEKYVLRPTTIIRDYRRIREQVFMRLRHGIPECL